MFPRYQHINCGWSFHKHQRCSCHWCRKWLSSLRLVGTSLACPDHRKGCCLVFWLQIPITSFQCLSSKWGTFTAPGVRENDALIVIALELWLPPVLKEGLVLLGWSLSPSVIGRFFVWKADTCCQRLYFFNNFLLRVYTVAHGDYLWTVLVV